MKPKNPPQKFREMQGDFYAENLLGLIPQNVKKKFRAKLGDHLDDIRNSVADVAIFQLIEGVTCAG